MSEHLCDACHTRPMAYVLCSAIGAMSNAYCVECQAAMTEPEWSFHYLWDCVCDGDRTKLVDYVRDLTTWKDGRVWTWDEWADWRTYHWFDPDPMFHYWAFEPYGPLKPTPEQQVMMDGPPMSDPPEEFDDLGFDETRATPTTI